MLLYYNLLSPQSTYPCLFQAGREIRRVPGISIIRFCNKIIFNIQRNNGNHHTVFKF